MENKRWLILSFLISLASLLLLMEPAIAHHPFGGETPSNFVEGFLSGLGHPIIGLDHFTFVVASGFLGATLTYGFLNDKNKYPN